MSRLKAHECSRLKATILARYRQARRPDGTRQISRAHLRDRLLSAARIQHPWSVTTVPPCIGFHTTGIEALWPPGSYSHSRRSRSPVNTPFRYGSPMILSDLSIQAIPARLRSCRICVPPHGLMRDGPDKWGCTLDVSASRMRHLVCPEHCASNMWVEAWTVFAYQRRAALLSHLWPNQLQ